MDLANLRRLAAADPHPDWEPGRDGAAVYAPSPGRGIRKVADIRGWGHLVGAFGEDRAAEIQKARTAFIASCSPANILELLAHLDWLREHVTGLGDDGPMSLEEHPVVAPSVNALRRLRALVLANTPGGDGLPEAPEGVDPWEAWEAAVAACLDEAEGRMLRAEELLLELQARRECPHCASGKPLGTVVVDGRETLRHAMPRKGGFDYARCRAELVREQQRTAVEHRRRAQKELKKKASA